MTGSQNQPVGSFLAYRTIPVTIFVTVVYVVLFGATLWTDSLSAVPDDTHGLDVDQAYADLHEITARPHPYHSHANDLVHSYLRSRIDDIVTGCEFVHVEEDSATTSFRVSAFDVVIFQPLNILVKIDGYDDEFRETGGVLFSAHYDSVSTAPGTTDNGIAVVSLLQLIDHFVKNRPRRTAIFNINNGEENGLFGAQAFIRHPWAKIVDTFMNLEGAGAGGPPLLFRATSTEPLQAFLGRGFATNTTRYRVTQPHGNVLSADAFERGVVRSMTDYSIYSNGSDKKIEGIDLAFYKRRSRYHTMFDSIPGAHGQAKEALWAMLENIWGAGGVLLNLEWSAGAEYKPAVYFDLFRKYFFVFEQSSLHKFNMTFLLGGPLLILMLYVGLPWYIRRSGERYTEEPQHSSLIATAWSHVRTVWSRGNFWIPTVMFLPSIVFQFLNTKLVLDINKYVTYSHPYTVILSNLSLALIIITFLLGSPAISARLRSPPPYPAYVLPDRHCIFLHLYAFTYLLLILASTALSKLRVGGLYWISAWHAGVCAASIIGGIQVFYARSQWIKQVRKKKRRLLRRDAGRNASRRGASSDSDEDERTPLLPGSQTLSELHGEVVTDKKDSSDFYWLLQVLLSVPMPVMLVGHVLLLFLDALGQTLSDGSSAAFVYIANAMLSFFIVLPIVPFASGIHRYVTYAAIIAYLGTVVYNLTVFPFSQETPLKVFFQQSIQMNATTQSALNNNVANMVSGEVIRAVTSLTGVREFIKEDIVAQLPSSWGKDVHCATDTSGRWQGLVTCSWESGIDMIPYPGGRTKHPWLSVNVERLTPSSARIEVEGKNARACRIYFNDRQVVHVEMRGDKENPGAILKFSPSPAGDTGSSLKRWTREWGERFFVELDINEFDTANGTPASGLQHDVPANGKNSTGTVGEDSRILRGRVACEWAEYESGMAGLDLNEMQRGGYLNPRMPALEEVFKFLPQWAIVSKAADGLVEAWSEFEV
ncbi:hypothetical protein AX17_006112 [Amanita inopinata Kibby_2008]|nr:hypothetical protein AX17_006112 [Amanita inopinata Kibby_2008]